MQRRQVLAAAALAALPGCAAAGRRVPPDPWMGVGWAAEVGTVLGADVAPDGRVASLSRPDSAASRLAVRSPTGDVLATQDVFLGTDPGPPDRLLPLQVHGETVLVQTGSVSAVDPATGDLRWSRDRFRLPHVVSGGVGYGRGWDSLFAMAVRSGDLHWTTRVVEGNDDAFGWPLALVAGTLVVAGGTADRGIVQGRNPETGVLVWQYEVPGEFPPVAVHEGTLLVGTNHAPADGPDAVVASLDPASGTERWRRPFPDAAFAVPRAGPAGVVADLARHEDFDEVAAGLDPETGATRWRLPGLDVRAVGEVAAGLDRSGRLVGLPLDGEGQVSWRRDVLGTADPAGATGIAGTRVEAPGGLVLASSAARAAVVAPEGTVRWHLDPPDPILGLRLRGRGAGPAASPTDPTRGRGSGLVGVLATRSRLYAMTG